MSFDTHSFLCTWKSSPHAFAHAQVSDACSYPQVFLALWVNLLNEEGLMGPRASFSFDGYTSILVKLLLTLMLKFHTCVHFRQARLKGVYGLTSRIFSVVRPWFALIHWLRCALPHFLHIPHSPRFISTLFKLCYIYVSVALSNIEAVRPCHWFCNLLVHV